MHQINEILRIATTSLLGLVCILLARQWKTGQHTWTGIGFTLGIICNYRNSGRWHAGGHLVADIIDRQCDLRRKSKIGEQCSYSQDYSEPRK